MIIHDKLVYNSSTRCHICNEELDEDSVRDHCHQSGKFRGAAHEICNLKYTMITLLLRNALNGKRGETNSNFKQQD